MEPTTHAEVMAHVEKLIDRASELCEEHEIPMAAVLAKTSSKNVVWWKDTPEADRGIVTVIGACRALVNEGRSFEREQSPMEGDNGAPTELPKDPICRRCKQPLLPPFTVCEACGTNSGSETAR